MGTNAWRHPSPTSRDPLPQISSKEEPKHYAGKLAWNARNKTHMPLLATGPTAINTAIKVRLSLPAGACRDRWMYGPHGAFCDSWAKGPEAKLAPRGVREELTPPFRTEGASGHAGKQGMARRSDIAGLVLGNLEGPQRSLGIPSRIQG